MTGVDRTMPSENVDEDSRRRCRERRRRRIEMRRLSVGSATGSSPPTSQSGGVAREEQRFESSTSVADGEQIRVKKDEDGDSPASKTPSSGSPVHDAEVPPAADSPPGGVPARPEPVFGTMSVSGKSREMEDAISVRTSLCCPEINGRRAVHFFAVYDGHGGSHVAALCRERMHVFLEEELMRVEPTGGGESGVGGCGSSSSLGRNGKNETKAEKWRRVLKRTFERVDEMALSKCSCGTTGQDCGCHPLEVALGGSTAIVAILTEDWIIVANCGDSRAVLGRGGAAFPLSVDHKPDRSDELARIEAAGGHVIYVNGARVAGILAMSRAIGDRYLKPFVISEPEITFTRRVPEDECLILASDGLWDVVSSNMACEVTRECLQEANHSVPGNTGSQIEGEGSAGANWSHSTLAAALLTRLALGRKSSDNISVIVVDLKRS